MVTIEELNINDKTPIEDQNKDNTTYEKTSSKDNAPETPEMPQEGVAPEPSNDHNVLEEERRQRAEEVSY